MPFRKTHDHRGCGVWTGGDGVISSLSKELGGPFLRRTPGHKINLPSTPSEGAAAMSLLRGTLQIISNENHVGRAGKEGGDERPCWFTLWDGLAGPVTQGSVNPNRRGASADSGGHIC